MCRRRGFWRTIGYCVRIRGGPESLGGFLSIVRKMVSACVRRRSPTTMPEPPWFTLFAGQGAWPCEALQSPTRCESCAKNQTTWGGTKEFCRTSPVVLERGQVWAKICQTAAAQKIYNSLLPHPLRKPPVRTAAPAAGPSRPGSGAPTYFLAFLAGV